MARKTRLTHLQKALIKPRPWRVLTRTQAEFYMNLRDAGASYEQADRATK